MWMPQLYVPSCVCVCAVLADLPIVSCVDRQELHFASVPSDAPMSEQEALDFDRAVALSEQ